MRKFQKSGDGASFITVFTKSNFEGDSKAWDIHNRSRLPSKSIRSSINIGDTSRHQYTCLLRVSAFCRIKRLEAEPGLKPWPQSYHASILSSILQI